MNTKRICIWSGPRNVSTAIMYAFAQRSDTRVVDEPLYGHYLQVTGALHPGRDEILAVMDRNGENVVREVFLGPCDRPVLFVKSMAHHFTQLSGDFLRRIVNVFLIRDPREMLPSLVNQIPEPTLADTGLKTQTDLLEDLISSGKAPPVLDARELLLNPAAVLGELCGRLGIRFQNQMLAWPAGPRPEDGIWAKHWYHNVHRSTGFQKFLPKTHPFPERLRPVLEECQPYYQRLVEFAIEAPAETERTQ